MKTGYTGGRCDTFLPTPPHMFFRPGTPDHVYMYDVNSLYPFVMHDRPLPCGKFKYFEGNIKYFNSYFYGEDINRKPFGIFEFDIITPEDLNIPVLQTRIQTKNGLRTIAPLGQWTGMYFSEEVYNAHDNFNYKFNIRQGYLFDKSRVLT